MIELLYDPSVWVSLLTLTIMEIVLGIDNIVFISVLVGKLEGEAAERARKLGLFLALISRVLLLMLIAWIVTLKIPVFTLFDTGFSWRDIILIIGGSFLLYKATHEIHAVLDTEDEERRDKGKASFFSVLLQILIIDIVFSVDSIITAVGLAEHVEVMIAAVIIAMGVMYAASGGVARFIRNHPTTKMLALAFLFLIGVVLVADGFHFHIPRGYIYFAMGFAALVEILNVFVRKRRKGRG